MNQQKAYKYRFYPSEEQKRILGQTFGCCRYVYNWALRERTDAYYNNGEWLDYKSTAQRLVLLKKQEETLWLNEVSSVPLQQALRHLERAFRHFFEGHAAYPTFKKKRIRQAATYVSNAFRWNGHALMLAKMDAPLDIHWSRPLPDGCQPTSVTVSKDEADRYFVSFLVQEQIKELPVVNKQVGLDLGLSRTLVKIDKFYPSSKRCFECGHILESLSLDMRIWTCPQCGVVHDRDVNAARNVLAAGQAVHACGEAVRPGRAKPKQALLDEAGKPRSDLRNPPSFKQGSMSIV